MRPHRVVLSRSALATVAADFFLMGLVVGAYGPLLEHLTRRFAVSLPVAGATISIHFAGALIGVLVAIWALARLEGRVTVMVAGAVAGAGCLAAGVAPSWPAFTAGVLVVGIGFGGLVVALNQLVAYSEGGRRAALLTGLNGAYSAGAVAGPVIVAAFAEDHFTFLFVVAAAAALALVAGATRISGRLPVGGRASGRSARVVLIFVGAVVLYVALETGTGGWMASHLERTGLSSVVAATATSGFFLALMAGRLLMTLSPARISESAIVLAGSAAGALCLLAAFVGALAPWPYVLAGLAIAPIFPTAVVWLARLRPGDARATAWLFPAVSIGGIAGPGAIGVVIAGFGVRWTPLVLAAVAVAMSAAFWGAERISSGSAA